MIIIDASVAVKWFVQEPGTQEAEALLVSDEPRAAPEHLTAEVAQAVLRHHREHGLSLEYCRTAILRVRRLVNLFSTEALAADALDIAAASGCSVYDALYVAAAERWDGIMVTADAKLIGKLKGSRWESSLRLLAPGRA